MCYDSHKLGNHAIRNSIQRAYVIVEERIFILNLYNFLHYTPVSKVGMMIFVIMGCYVDETIPTGHNCLLGWSSLNINRFRLRRTLKFPN
jgi:hypothetical protein